MSSNFELRRQTDDLVYSFTRADRPDGLFGYRRADRDLWITFRPGLGWVAWDDESQTVMGRPWHVLPQDQSPQMPPEGDWVSKKGSKSHVYSLVHTGQQPPSSALGASPFRLNERNGSKLGWRLQWVMGWTPPAASMCQSGGVEHTT